MPRTMFIDKKRKHLVLFQPLIKQESSFILLLVYTHTHTYIRTHTHDDIYLLHSSGFRGLETFLLLAEITHTQILWTKYCRWPLVNIIFNFSNNVVVDDTTTPRTFLLDDCQMENIFLRSKTHISMLSMNVEQLVSSSLCLLLFDLSATVGWKAEFGPMGSSTVLLI